MTPATAPNSTSPSWMMEETLAKSFVDFAKPKALHTRLLRYGLMEVMSSSRPEYRPGEILTIPPRSSARALLKHAGTWKGDDLEKRLRDVYATRGEAEF